MVCACDRFLTLKERLTRDVLLKLDALTLPRATPRPKPSPSAAASASGSVERKAPAGSGSSGNGITTDDYVMDGSSDDIATIDFDYEAPDPVWRARRKERVAMADSLIAQLEAIAAQQRRAARM